MAANNILVEAVAALRGLLGDHTRLYRLEGPALLQGMLVESQACREELGGLWRLDVGLLGTDAGLDLSTLLGQRATLITRLADGSEHRRSGLIHAWQQGDSDGALARWRISLMPWAAALLHTQRSQLWQQRSLIQIIESVFAAYPQAAWRWAPCVAAHLAQSPRGPDGLRSLCTQYRESDWGFVQRLLAEEGLNLRFEQDEAAPLGHRMVIFADSRDVQACPDLGTLRFHRAESVESRDTLQSFGGLRRLPVAEVLSACWDEQGKQVLAAASPTVAAFGGPNAPRLQAYDFAGEAVFADAAGAQRASELMLQAHECRMKTWLGAGSVRGLVCGSRFTLADSPLAQLGALADAGASDSDFLITELECVGLNNLPSSLQAHLQTRLAPSPWDLPADGDWDPLADQLPRWVSPTLRQQAQRLGHAVQLQASRVALPWRPLLQDERGQRLHPKPSAPQYLTATVVDAQGSRQPQGADELHMDAQGRVRIQYDFQEAHPGGPETARATPWVRVLQSAAGAGQGLQFIPRIGQEVLVTFLGRDIDRPVVVGALYNGQGEAPESAQDQPFAQSSDHRPSAQGNRLGAGHSPAWHGASPHSHSAGGQANAAALSGFKTKEFGANGFNQLVFDDTPGQLRTQLATTQHATQLNLGHLVHQADNHRGSFRGLGFELRTDAYGAVRAGQGLLISSYGLPEQEPAGDNVAGMALANQLKTLGQSFSQAASTHQTVALAAHQGSHQAQASSLSSQHAPFNALHAALSGQVGQLWPQAQADAATLQGTTQGPRVPHTTAPVISVNAKAGLLSVAGQDQLAVAQEGISLAAGGHSSLAVGGASRIHSGQAIGMLGGAIQPGSQAAGTGLTAIAAQGPISLQAQASTLQVAAKGPVHLQSASAHIDWAAAKKISLTTAGGANITLEGGNITVQCPGKITVKASVKKFGGAGRVNYALPILPSQVCVECLRRRAAQRSALVSKG